MNREYRVQGPRSPKAASTTKAHMCCNTSHTAGLIIMTYKEAMPCTLLLLISQLDTPHNNIA